MNWYRHLLLAFIFLLFTLLILFHIFPSLKFSFELLIFASFPFLIGSLLPDIDHPSSKIRKIFNLFLLIFSFVLSYTILSFILEFGVLFVLFFLLLTVAIFLITTIMIPKHRGPLHSGMSAVIFGIFCFLLIWKIYDFELGLVGGICGMLGYLSHVTVDYFT
jgi:inner membrane protein